MNDQTAPFQETSRQRGSSLAILVLCVGLAILAVVLGVKLHRLNARADRNTQAAPATAAQKQAVQAKPDTAQAQAELDKARAASAQLQTQLDQAKKQQRDLQAQLDKAKAQATGMQSQLDRAAAQSADLQSQLDKAMAQSADLQTQLAKAKAGSSQLAAQLDQSKARSTDLQSRLQKAEGEIAADQPLVQKARHMPVMASFEKVRGGPFQLVGGHATITLHIGNLYLRPLSAVISVTGAETNRSQSCTIGGGAMLDVEKLAAGDKIVISSEGYDPLTLTAQ
ncbi:MAG TPA: hypothetical protein VN775_03325 [Opitutaceae bacterium]|nr:hypothetical protein [Opitutaceae bacterium]